ncbi:hypothetical protein RB195_010193 [Necator americanus]|uniref:Uncharacterized protein n=1 Tax=Necator americanus TaxID=51031 RepID=A0ABR1CYP4_NECAM
MEGRYYLPIVDAYFKRPEIVLMSSISSATTIQAMRDLTNGTRGVKMESQFNRRNGARRRSFEDCFAKDYRGQKLVLSGSSHAVLETQHCSLWKLSMDSARRPVTIQDRHNSD